MARIELTNVVKSFETGRNTEVTALKEVNLTVRDKEFITLVGASGCGKSTLLNALFAPGRGELWVGLDLWPASCRRYLRLRLAG